MKKIKGFARGMGIGGWLTNYKRFNVLPPERRMQITIGDMEHFESYITERDVAYIASLGFDHIRLGFDQIVVEKAPYIYRDVIVAILHRFVGWCKKYGLTPVLNMHKALGNYCDILEEKGLFEDKGLMDRFIAVWLMLEDEFHADEEVIFELLNEVVNATAEQWNALAKRTVAALREKNKTRRIILGCTEWNNPPGLKDLCVLSDENVFYTFHCYAPHEFTHQRGVLQAQQLFYNREMPYPTEDIERYRDYHRVVNGNEHAYPHLDRMDKAFLYEYLAPVKEWIEKHPDKILWCGEFGTIRHAKLAWRENWMRDMISILNEWDIPYCVWNYLSTPNDGNRFSLVDDDTRELLGEGFKSILLGNG
jgi:hypothetical protein